MKRIRIIGAGLAGSEAAWQCARRGVAVELVEMRPVRATPAHQTDNFAELVCSNSLKSESENTAPWLLKEEMRRAGSLLLEIARETAVPAGHALAVDRAEFSRNVTEAISREPLITVRREEVTQIEADESMIVVVATGPLTSDNLSREIARLCAASSGPSHLYFYDSISPIVEAGSIDMSKVYLAARYDKGSADYINCPMSKDEYDKFYDALLAAQSVEQKDWENLNYFESCLPIEEIARRGRDTLRFGPMKPVGLKDPRTGRIPYAAVQLRQENLRADSYNLVGFQNHLKFGEQARVLGLIPGLESARFLRYGQIHRNTYINAPALLNQTLQMKAHPHVMFAGQICGVEGYVESIATGLMAGLNAAALATGTEPVSPPRATALGSLVHYITQAESKNFQPANITFDLLPALDRKVRDRKERHRQQCELALQEFGNWLRSNSLSAMDPVDALRYERCKSSCGDGASPRPAGSSR
ncbi:MAG TPA: methylenetetrahydrofolate--tRNA-(uracil(54)-C(5))-methyltransferase (FADH(2)-oxidizing) TrmFO [Terriglobales bacterium]|nr:methylenetetrahydrofolate--tRNA-(uracil(54)-C(5))-methyltransferase (FADH(2)-oxidizing) TrmFO [Terriglobales bacterium]